MSIIVTRDDGTVFDNLRGVFKRRFPIVVAQVRSSGRPQGVTYYGERYTIARGA